jgi:hypothetical protein
MIFEQKQALKLFFIRNVCCSSKAGLQLKMGLWVTRTERERKRGRVRKDEGESGREIISNRKL